MSDRRLAELERRFRATGTVEDELAWLKERGRLGALPAPSVQEVRAALGTSESSVLVRSYAASAHDLDAPLGEDGWTLLHHAIEQEDEAAIRLLARFGADLEVTEACGSTPLTARWTWTATARLSLARRHSCTSLRS